MQYKNIIRPEKKKRKKYKNIERDGWDGFGFGAAGWSFVALSGEEVRILGCVWLLGKFKIKNKIEFLKSAAWTTTLLLSQPWNIFVFHLSGFHFREYLMALQRKSVTKQNIVGRN